MKKIILLLAFVLLAGGVYAQEITSYSVDTSIEDVVVHETITLTLLNTHEEGLTDFTYPFSGRLYNLVVTDSSGRTLRYSSDFKGGKTYVTTYFENPLLGGENYTIFYKFDLQGQITKMENTYILTETHSLLANVKNFALTIALPEGFGLVEVSPGPNKIVSDGRRHILSWQLNEPIPIGFRGFKVIVLYEKLVPPWWVGKEKHIYGAMVVIVFSLLGGIAYLRVRSKEKVESKIEVLKEDEQEIMKLIIENDGIDQRDIQRETGFSKAKVSKILSELERRGIIRKEPYGRRNKIFLTKKIKET
jgi:uncharacterized membrane protein